MSRSIFAVSAYEAQKRTRARIKYNSFLTSMQFAVWSSANVRKLRIIRRGDSKTISLWLESDFGLIAEQTECFSIHIVHLSGCECFPISDTRTNHWPLISSPLPGLSIIAVYLYFTLSWGPRYMANRKPFQLERILIVYNFIQVIISTWIFYEVGVGFWVFLLSSHIQYIFGFALDMVGRLNSVCYAPATISGGDKMLTGAFGWRAGEWWGVRSWRVPIDRKFDYRSFCVN